MRLRVKREFMEEEEGCTKEGGVNEMSLDFN